MQHAADGKPAAAAHPRCRQPRRERWRGSVALLVAFAVVATLPACGPPPAIKRVEPRGPEPRVRVGVAVNVAEAVLTLRGPYRLRTNESEEPLEDATVLRVVASAGEVIAARPDGAEAGDTERIVLDPLAGGCSIELGASAYAGRIECIGTGDQVTVVNELGIEEYLRGVVPWEIGWRPQPEEAAVEAQAVVARTYACKRLGQYPDRPFDLTSDVSDQVYRGTTRPDSVADGAIARTRGAVLLAGEDLVEGYYSSTCGGHTSRIDAVWSKPFAPYLLGVRDAPDVGGTFCAHSPYFRWTEAWSGAEMELLLARTLPPELGLSADEPIGTLLDVRTVGRSASGRVESLEVETAECIYVVRGDRIRWVLRRRDGNILRSILVNLEVERQNDRIVRVIARGGGNGHGVGMCQNGALEMARRGYDRDAILGHYYPGTTLHRIYE